MIKKVFYNRIYKSYFLLFFILFSVEIIFKIVLKIPVIDWPLLRIFISSNIIAMFLSCLFSLFGDKISNLFTIVTSLIISVYAILQAGFYNFLGVFISIGTSSQLNAVKDFIRDFFDSFLPTFYLIFVPFFIVLVYYFIFERIIKIALKNQKISFADKYNSITYKKEEEELIKSNEKQSVKFARKVMILLCFIFCLFYYYSLTASFMQNDIQLKTPKELFLYPDMPNLAVVQFGVTSYGLLDVESTLFPKKIDDEILAYVKPEVKLNDNNRIIDDTIWEVWASSTNDKNYQNLNNYYLSKTITAKNEYTGLFKNKNLIVIMMESANNIIMNEEYYPNINKLAKEGWNFTNAFSPRNSCNTGNNEMSGMTSLYTINNTCTANVYKNNIYPEAIFNLFNNKKYETSSYHDYVEHYYSRNIIHPNMGSKKYYNAQTLGIPYNAQVYEEWANDVDLMSKFLEKIDTSKRFMSWITTVSTHQPFSVSSSLGDKYLDLFKDTNYNISLKRYMSKLKVLDDAIGTLVNGLEEKGILKDTVIVLYADHYPYGISTNILNTYFDYDVKENNEVDRTPFIIYNPSLTPTKYETYTSYMNIVPTLANLFDLDYDPRLYSGHDIFSSDYENRVVFADGSWQDDIAFYNATTGKIKYYTDNQYDNSFIKMINKNINTDIKMANLAITSNYFYNLFENKKKYETESVVPINVASQSQSNNKNESK